MSIDYSQLALPKPEPRQRAKARVKRVRAAARKRCVDLVWLRAGGRCEACGVRVSRDVDRPLAMGHVHERLARSLGGDPTDPEGCVLLCVKCHMPGPSGAHRRSER